MQITTGRIKEEQEMTDRQRERRYKHQQTKRIAKADERRAGALDCKNSRSIQGSNGHAYSMSDSTANAAMRHLGQWRGNQRLRNCPSL